MTVFTDTPAEINSIAWLDLGERIGVALAVLHEVNADSRDAKRLQGKMEGLEEAQAEFQRLEAAQTPYLSYLAQWLTRRLKNPASTEERNRWRGYTLALDYTRAY